MTESGDQWVDYLEGELDLEAYELRGSLLRRSIPHRVWVTQLESLRESIKLSDPVDDHIVYLTDPHVNSNLHEKIMQSVMAAPEPVPKASRSQALLKLYSGLEKTLGLRKPQEKS